MALVYLAVQSSTRVIYFPKKDTYDQDALEFCETSEGHVVPTMHKQRPQSFFFPGAPSLPMGPLGFSQGEYIRSVAERLLLEPSPEACHIQAVTS